MNRVENLVAKGETAHYEHKEQFLLFTTMFSKVVCCDVVCIGEMVKTFNKTDYLYLYIGNH